MIVTARNEEETVERCLSALLKQDYPSYEVLFVDAGSQDNTLAIARKMAAQNSSIKIIQFEGNPSQCRNMASKLSRSDVVAFTDADVEVPHTWLTQTVGTLYSDPEVGGVGGPNQPTRENSGEIIDAVDLMLTTSLGSMKSAQSYGFKEKTGVKSIPCCNATYRRQLLADMGGFDEELVGCDDTDLGYRINRSGKKILFDPEARVLHSVKFRTLVQFARLMFKYGRGRGYAAKKKRYLFSGPALPAAGVTVGLPILLLASVALESLLPVLIILLGYAVAVIAYSIAVAIHRKAVEIAALGPVVLTTEYASYFLGFFAGVLDRRSNRWSS